MDLSNRYNYSTDYQKKSTEALETALDTAPYYKGWRSFDPGSGVSIDKRYAAMPELTKKAMRESFPYGLVSDRLNVEQALSRDEIEYTFTSGTTDEKVINLWNQKWWNASEAASWKLNSHTARLDYPQKDAKLASALNIGIHCEEDLPMSHRILGNHLYLNEKLSILSWQPRHFERMAQELNEYKPAILEANPSLLARLAWWAIDNGRELYSPQAIVFTYEFPSLIILRAIREVFSSPFISSYGTTETGFVMMQCEDGFLHQNTDFCRIDFYPLKERHGGPELGRILVTTFGNPWSTVVRFDTGDLIRLHPSGKCSCGRGQGLIAEAVEGRTANVTFTTEGNLITTMALDKALSLIPEIRDYHFEQRSPRQYELQAVLSGGSSGVPDRIKQILEALYGKDGEYTITVVSELFPGPAGKFRRTQANFEFDQKGLFI